MLREVGRGGLGRVEEILITETNSPLPVGARYARKKLNDKWASNTTALARFNREIQALKRMEHPNIVPVYGENLANANERFFVMPLYPSNLRLALHLNRRGFPWSDVARFGAQIADALAYAHSQGFTHRDIKPENILLDQLNNPIIADWGLGYFVHEASVVLVQLTVGGMGTEYYCSMEQWSSGKCDNTGDVYSLGITLAEIAAGRQMAISHVGAGIEQDVITPATSGAVHFNKVIRAMTAHLPDRRLQTMEDVALELRRAADAGSWLGF